MRKTHWELVNKNEILTLSVSIVAKAVKATNGIHNHADDFRHIDCVQNHIKDFMPKEFTSGPSVMISPLRTFLFYYMFKEAGGLVFRMAKDFADELKQTKIKVPARVIPADNRIICVEFPEGHEYACVYIGCVDNPGADSRGQVYKRLEFQFMRPLAREDRFDRYVLHFYSEDEVVEDAVDLLRETNPEFFVPIDQLKFALNCFLYIHSGRPDLREYKPQKRPLTKKPKEQRRYDKLMEDKDGIPVMLVGFNFLKETQVGAHMQRYWTGKGRTDLVWVYKNAYSKGGAE